MQITPDIILKACMSGLFPMAEARDGAELHWHDPPQRGILPLESFHVPRRLRRTLRQKPYAVTVNAAFPAVIRACADARAATWINDEIISLYTALHRQGHAHSVEAWKDGALAGGVYGIAIGGAFFGESMFSAATDASKIALVHLAARLRARGFTLLDAQFFNPHLVQFGLVEITRAAYRSRLREALKRNAVFYSGASAAGASSEEKSCLAAELAAFLQSMSHTS